MNGWAEISGILKCLWGPRFHMNAIIKLLDIVKETYVLQTEMAFLVLIIMQSRHFNEKNKFKQFQTG